jgi:hypothetical protein
VSDHGHPSARQRHEDAALERAFASQAERRAAELARVRETERSRLVGVLVQDAVETDFEGCVG